MARSNSKDGSGDILRILVATDNHLGVYGKDPERSDDSFVSMDEIFQIGADAGVDMVLLGGDLFHHNKPSRKTMMRTLKLFRERCLGQNPVHINVVSDQAVNFSGAPNKVVNYEDPNMAVHLPVFIIHGNHDDPTREGDMTSRSAVDVLQTVGLVNYFGKIDNFKQASVHPVLIEKGDVKLALYGMGWIRDERLNRMFENDEVHFVRPEENPDSWFNIFTVHQNRDMKGRGSKNCFKEKSIPSFMDFVLWAHEHECLIDLFESEGAGGMNMITQPGSSVATSLIEGESAEKHVGILEIRASSDPEEPQNFRWSKKKLTSVRPFMFDDIDLSSVKELDAKLPPDEKKASLFEYLTIKTNEMIERAQECADDGNPYQAHFRNPENGNAVVPIVRIRVENSDFPALNLQHFGQQFVGKVANPNEVLRFYKSKKKNPTGAKKRGSAKDDAENDVMFLDELEDAGEQVSSHHKISSFVAQNLANADGKLKVLNRTKLNRAIEAFVKKEESSAIASFVEEQLEELQLYLKKSNVGASEDEVVSVMAKRNEEVDNMLEEEAKKNENDSSSSALNSNGASSSGNKNKKRPAGDIRSALAKKKKARTKKQASAKKKAPAPKRSEKRKYGKADDEIDLLASSEESQGGDSSDADEWKPASRKAPPSTVASECDDDDGSVDAIDVPELRRSPRKRTRTSRARAQKKTAAASKTKGSAKKRAARYGVPKGAKRTKK